MVSGLDIFIEDEFNGPVIEAAHSAEESRRDPAVNVCDEMFVFMAEFRHSFVAQVATLNSLDALAFESCLKAVCLSEAAKITSDFILGVLPPRPGL